MSQKIIITVGVVVLAILALFMFNGPGNQSVSPNILYITQPATSFSGIVAGIEGNRITVSQKQTLTQNMIPPAAINPAVSLSPIPTPKIVTITYQVTITDKTQVSQPAPYINYLFKTVTPAPMAKLSTKDIKVGQMITVNSAVDLRTLKSNEFEATTINLSQITNTLSGKIVSVTNNTLTLKAFAPMAAGIGAGAGNEKVFTVTVNQDTEISRTLFSTSPMLIKPGEAPQPPKNEKLALSDLKKDMQVTVYTAEDVTESQSLTALRIEPMQAPQAIMPNPSPSSAITGVPVPSISPIPSASASPSIKP